MPPEVDEAALARLFCPAAEAGNAARFQTPDWPVIHLDLKRSMRQGHRAGEKLFVDYAGQTLPIVEPNAGTFWSAQVFVAVLGASNYTYA